MLNEHIEMLCKELDITPVPKWDQKKILALSIGYEKILCKDLQPGLSMQAPICPTPQKRKEEIFSHIMHGNLLGQGTGLARIGLDHDEKFLTLCLGLPYELSYQQFRDRLEDFVGYINYWRTTIANMESEASLI